MQYLSRRRFLVAVAALPTIRFAGAAETKPEWGEKLEAIRLQYKLPALGGAIVTSAGLQSVAVTGLRKFGSDVVASVDDLWHLGSNTKAMTSTLAAVAVEAGKIAWIQLWKMCSEGNMTPRALRSKEQH
jgi:D-alanyl-D-alanine carboxypeptidase